MTINITSISLINVRSIYIIGCFTLIVGLVFGIEWQ